MNFRSKSALSVLLVAALVAVLLAGPLAAQGRPKSPAGTASTQIGDNWIDISYSRPILRDRRGIFGSGDSYGEAVYAGAPLWRVGADVTTRVKTGMDLEIGGTTVPAGEYSLFIELEEGAWTAVLSSQPYMEEFNRELVSEGQTWGAYGYSSDHDVARAPMTVTVDEASIDQMTIVFSDVTAAGGNLVVAWDNTVGSLPFKVR